MLWCAAGVVEVQGSSLGCLLPERLSVVYGKNSNSASRCGLSAFDGGRRGAILRSRVRALLA